MRPGAWRPIEDHCLLLFFFEDGPIWQIRTVGITILCEIHPIRAECTGGFDVIGSKLAQKSPPLFLGHLEGSSGRCHSTAAFRNCTLKETSGHRRCYELSHRHSSGGFSKDRHIRAVAPELCDVVFHPLQTAIWSWMPYAPEPWPISLLSSG